MEIMYGLIATIVVMVTFALFSVMILKPLAERWLNIREKETKNELFKLYLSVNPDNVLENITNLAIRYINEYGFTRFRLENKHISSENAEQMVQTVTEALFLDISEYYLFQIKLIYAIDEDDDVLAFLHKIVQEQAVIYITEHNKPT